jgi:hypothetical protein
VCTRNGIRDHSHTDDSRRLIPSSSEVTSVIEKAKTLAAKEKTVEFKSQRERDQLRIALENEEHRGHTRAISSIAYHGRKGLWMKAICTRSVKYKR